MLNDTKFQQVIIIEPDATSDLGHFRPYAQNLALELGKRYPVHFLLNWQSQLTLPEPASANYCLSTNSWSIGLEEESNNELVGRFTRDVISALGDFTNEQYPLMVYMYCGSFPHVKAILDVSVSFPQAFFCVNLFYLPFQSFLTHSYRAKWQSVLSSVQCNNRLLLTSPTSEASDAVRIVHKWYIDPAPHPCPSLSDIAALQSVERAKAALDQRSQKRVRVLFPGSSRDEKGIGPALRAVKALAQSKERRKYDIAVRATKFRREHWRTIEAVRDRVQVVEGPLSDEAFDELLKNASIVVLPYRREDFEYRTSGLLLEAIYRGKPCIVLEGTWLGNFVARHGCGVVVRSLDEKDLVDGILYATRRLAKLEGKAIAAATDHCAHSGWGVLRRLITNESSAADVVGRIGQFVAGRKLPEDLVVLGNGPSLKGFDFARLRRFDVIGMNAAYRFWERIGWYPRYYACLDKVVGLSHKQAIESLVTHSEDNGIELFLLRENLIEHSTLLANRSNVINFDAVRKQTRLLSDPLITTGSHAALFGVYLGYRRVYLLGIDCDYVQQVHGARRVQAKASEESVHTLEIAEAPAQNPNYFFDDYQRKGDRFNIPNPGRAVHIDSWRVASALMRAEGARVLSANLKSKVDAFDFCEFGAVEPGGTPRIVAREAVLGPIGDWPEELFGRIRTAGVLRGPHEPGACVQFDETGFVARLVLKAGRDGVMVDVGAQRGAASRRFADAGWQVIAHEPDADNRVSLEAWARGRANVVIDTRAVADVSGKELTLYASPESTGISSLLAFRDSHAPKSTVRTCTIADVVVERRLERIDVLKIDAEGYDLPILRGGPWDRVRPEVIICEYEDRKTRALDYGVDDMARFLELKGYWVLVSEWHPIEKYGGPHSWKRLFWHAPGQCAGEGWGNLIAFRSPPLTSHLLAAADEQVRVLARQSKDYHTAPSNVRKGQEMSAKRPRQASGAKKAIWWGGVAGGYALAASAAVAALLMLPAEHAALEIAMIALITAVAGLSVIFGLARRESRRRKRRDEKLRETLEGSRKRVETLERLLKQARDALGQADDRITARQDELERTLKDARDALGQADDRITARQDALERTSKEQRQELERLRGASSPHLATFTRYPDPETMGRLMGTWAPKLNLRLDEPELRYLAHRLRTIEANGIGRMATSMEAALLRLLAARAVPRDRLDVLEIGTLFGLGAAAVYEGARGRFDEVHLTLIDPLRGYYGDGRPDPITGAIADREVLLCNLRQAGARIEDVTIVQGRSEDEAVRARAAERRYDLLIVDGDHSAKGVARDFERYAPLVRKGGFILFDDYDVPEWPAIKAFVDEEVACRSELALLGGEFRTAVFKVRSVVVFETAGDPEQRHTVHRLESAAELKASGTQPRKSGG